MKFELTKILEHQKTGNNEATKSPQRPFDFILVCTFGSIRSVLLKKIFSNTLLKRTITAINDIHHQYCHTVKLSNVDCW